MKNRASIVRASTSFALNRNALSGGSGLTCATAGRAAANPSTARSTHQRRSGGDGRGLGDDPVEVGSRSIGDGDSDDFRKFVRVAPADDLFHAGKELVAGLDRERSLLGRFDFAAPGIQ